MPKYNHAFDFGFEVLSNCPEASDVTADMLVEAARARIDRLADPNRPEAATMLDACQCFDTHETN